MIEYISPIRYAFEYFIRNEFSGDELGFDIADVEYNFNLTIAAIIGILVVYFFLMVLLTVILLKCMRKRLEN